MFRKICKYTFRLLCYECCTLFINGSNFKYRNTLNSIRDLSHEEHTLPSFKRSHSVKIHISTQNLTHEISIPHHPNSLPAMKSSL